MRRADRHRLHLCPQRPSLTNPTRPGTALIGCSSLALTPVLAGVIAERGAIALVVRGHDGLDEITTADAADLWTAGADDIGKLTFDTAKFGLRRARPGDLAGGDAAYNAKVVHSVVHSVVGGDPGAARRPAAASARRLLRGRPVTASCQGR